MTHYKNLASAAAVDGAHVRSLLAGNAAAARGARAMKRIEDNFTVHVQGDEMCFTLVGDVSPTVYVAAVFGADGALEAVAREGFYSVTEEDLRAFEQIAMNRAVRNAQKREARTAYEAGSPARQARLAAAAMLDAVLTGSAEEKAAYAASPACAEMRRRTAAGAYGQQLAGDVKHLVEISA